MFPLGTLTDTQYTVTTVSHHNLSSLVCSKLRCGHFIKVFTFAPARVLRLLALLHSSFKLVFFFDLLCCLNFKYRCNRCFFSLQSKTPIQKYPVNWAMQCGIPLFSKLVISKCPQTKASCKACFVCFVLMLKYVFLILSDSGSIQVRGRELYPSGMTL